MENSGVFFFFFFFIIIGIITTGLYHRRRRCISGRGRRSVEIESDSFTLRPISAIREGQRMRSGSSVVGVVIVVALKRESDGMPSDGTGRTLETFALVKPERRRQEAENVRVFYIYIYRHVQKYILPNTMLYLFIF